jgi:metallophosphoesterase superfamily enzyme
MNFVFRQAINVLGPTHVVFLGDLLSSQHIPDDEFKRRVDRFKTIFNVEDFDPERVVYLAGNHDIGKDD